MLIGGKIGRVRDVAKAVGGRFSISIYFSFSVETNQESDGIIHGSARNRSSELLSVSSLLLLLLVIFGNALNAYFKVRLET